MTQLLDDNVIINGNRIACGAWGEGEPVILIHGTPSHSHIWRNVMPKLVAAGHRVYLFDLLGFGASERPRDPSVDTSVGAQDAVVTSLMAHWGLERAHIVSNTIRANRFGPIRVMSSLRNAPPRLKPIYSDNAGRGAPPLAGMIGIRAGARGC
jgi:hypothetical protein